MKNEKYVVYTVVTGNYDEIQPVKVESNIDFVIVSDDLLTAPDGWTLLKVKRGELTSIEFNRLYKMKPHLLFRNYEKSIYVDANIDIIGSLYEKISSVLIDSDIALYDHPVRSSIYSEAEVLKKMGYDYFFNINKQMKEYKKLGFESNVLFEANIIFRNHNEKIVVLLMNFWYCELIRGVKRDQLSLTFSCYQFETVIKSLGVHDARFINSYFKYRLHMKKNKSRNLKARFINLIARYIKIG